MKKAAILAAGEGSRLKPLHPVKPIVKINGTELLEMTFNNLAFNQFEEVSIIFNSEQSEQTFSQLQCLKRPGVTHFFMSTQSSMHSLWEVSKKLNLLSGEHFFVSMVDSIVKPKDALEFQHFCQKLSPLHSALLITSHVEDEKPLTLKINALSEVTEFQCPDENGVYITSGVYCFSSNVLPLLNEMILAGHSKLRNFLTELVRHQHIIKTFYVDKTLDIDRPEDIISAEAFLL